MEGIKINQKELGHVSLSQKKKKIEWKNIGIWRIHKYYKYNVIIIVKYWKLCQIYYDNIEKF